MAGLICDIINWLNEVKICTIWWCDMTVTFDSTFAFGYPKEYDLKDFEPFTHELIYFLTGEGTTTINQVAYPYRPHTICFTKKGDIRDHYCQVKTDYICIRFTSDVPIESTDSGVYECDTDELRSLFKKLQKEVIEKRYNYLHIANLVIMEILFRLNRIKMVYDYDEGLYGLIDEIDTTLFFKKSIQEMAIEVGYSYDHFRHKFKEITGVAPLQYIINKRIEHACHLLSKETLTCTEIALLCGFSSSAQMSKLFKRVMGISPNEYKKLNQ